MPKQVRCGDRALELAWKAVHEGGVSTRVLVIARDVTEQREAAKAEREAKEIHDLIGSILRDKAAFAASVSEARDLLRIIASDDSDAMRRALHTLKGNMPMFGFHGVAASCHELESELAESGGRPTESQVANLREQLDETMQRMQDVVGTDFLSLVEVSARDVDELIHALDAGHDRSPSWNSSAPGETSRWRPCCVASRRWIMLVAKPAAAKPPVPALRRASGP